MLPEKFVYLALALCFFADKLKAQEAPGSPQAGTIIKVAKFKPPAVTTFLGRNSATADVTVDEANQLISLPLKIADGKNNIYTVSSYQFMYKKKSIVENESGKKEVVFTTVADIFKATPLPILWRSAITGGIQKGEELYFFDVLAKDKLNRVFYAPEVKIRVQ